MKKLMFLFAFVAALFATLTFSSCEPIDTTEPETTVSDQPDDAGNLVIQNGSGYRLALYNGDERWRIIPASIEDFLVEISNPNNHTNDLVLKRVDDNGEVADEIFKRWTIPLAGDNEPEHRCTWIITDNDEEQNSGTISFSYYDAENYVEVFLNAPTGALIRKLKPGDQNIGATAID